MDDDMNPLRLATLDASPFCCAKRGGDMVVLDWGTSVMAW